MTSISIKSLTLDELRVLRKITLPHDIAKIIDINTYYRIRNGDYKFWARDSTLEKLRKALRVDEKTFKKVLENQLKANNWSQKEN